MALQFDGVRLVDANGNPADYEGQKATFRAVYYGAMAATPSDIFTLQGSATKLIKVRRVVLKPKAAAAGSMDFALLKRTAANTGGTTAAITPVALDSNDAAATAVPVSYSVNPTGLGSGVIVDEGPVFFSTGAAMPDRASFTFGDLNTRALALRGVSQFLAISGLFSAVPTTGVLGIMVEWTEE